MTRTAGYRGNTRRFTCKLRGPRLSNRAHGSPREPAPRPNLVPEIAMYPVGQVVVGRFARAKVIKAFVLPVHWPREFVAIQSRFEVAACRRVECFDRGKNASIPCCSIEPTRFNFFSFFFFQGFSLPLNTWRGALNFFCFEDLYWERKELQ